MNLESLRILVADPDPAACKSLGWALRTFGADIQCVGSGADVLFHTELEPPDVLILEGDLPDIDGFEVCERVRHELRNSLVTIIVMTRPDDELTKTYLGPMVQFVGGDYFVAKPFDPTFIVCLLSELENDVAGNRRVNSLVHPTRSRWPTSREFMRPMVAY